MLLGVVVLCVYVGDACIDVFSLFVLFGCVYFALCWCFVLFCVVAWYVCVVSCFVLLRFASCLFCLRFAFALIVRVRLLCLLLMLLICLTLLC